MKYHIVTHGCQMNEHDSERIAFLLEQCGYQQTDLKNEADFILFNTCLVRENAELKVFGQVGALKKWRNEKQGRILAVSGCMMQTGEARDIIRTKFPQVDIVFGTQNIAKLPMLIEQHRKTGERVFDISSYDDLELSYSREGHSFAYVNIMTGCNNFCSYCIVPYARGREESRRAGDIVQEVESLAQQGILEVMLLGQNVNSYGENPSDFPNLLRRIHEIDGIQRIRFISSHPKDLSQELIDTIADCPKIERHFHLPLQSGSNKVLYEMNRRYTRERYLDLVSRLRKAVPDIAISTDIIVGFPGETEQDHNDTLDLCRRVEFDTAFTFLYSPRPGTPAAKRKDFIEERVAGRRFQELLDTLYPIFLKKNQAEIGKTVQVLFESVSKQDRSRLTGRDSKGKLIHVPAGEALIGRLCDVVITDANSFALQGELKK